MNKVVFLNFFNKKKRVCRGCGSEKDVKKTSHGYYCDDCYMIEFVQPEVDKIDRNTEHQRKLRKR